MTGSRLLALVVVLLAVGALAVPVAPGGAAPASQPTPTPAEPGTPTATVTPSPTPASAALSLSAEAEVADSDEGLNATVEVRLRNEGGNDSVAPVVRVEALPEGWRVVGQESENGTWRASTREWLWLVVEPGESVTAELRLRAAADASGGEVALVAFDEADNRDPASATLAAGGPTPTRTDEGSGLAVFAQAAGGIETPGPLALGVAGLFVLGVLAGAVLLLRRVAGDDGGAEGGDSGGAEGGDGGGGAGGDGES